MLSRSYEPTLRSPLKLLKQHNPLLHWTSRWARWLRRFLTDGSWIDVQVRKPDRSLATLRQVHPPGYWTNASWLNWNMTPIPCLTIQRNNPNSTRWASKHRRIDHIPLDLIKDYWLIRRNSCVQKTRKPSCLGLSEAILPTMKNAGNTMWLLWLKPVIQKQFFLKFFNDYKQPEECHKMVL